MTWSVLDHDRRPKAGYGALAEACRPVIVVAERPPAVVAPGDALALDVHVVSDLRHPVTGATVDRLAVLGRRRPPLALGGGPAGRQLRAGGHAAVRRRRRRPAPLRLDLELAAEDRSATNAYSAVIAPTPPG